MTLSKYALALVLCATCGDDAIAGTRISGTATVNGLGNPVSPQYDSLSFSQSDSLQAEYQVSVYGSDDPTTQWSETQSATAGAFANVSTGKVSVLASSTGNCVNLHEWSTCGRGWAQASAEITETVTFHGASPNPGQLGVDFYFHALNIFRNAPNAGSGTFFGGANLFIQDILRGTAYQAVWQVGAGNDGILTQSFQQVGWEDPSIIYLPAYTGGLFGGGIPIHDGSTFRVSLSIGGSSNGLAQFNAMNTGGLFFNVSEGFSFTSESNSFLSQAQRFSISSVPEPSSWVMFILGIGAAGAAMRRHRQLRLSLI